MYRENSQGRGEEGLTVYHLTEVEQEALRGLAQPVFQEIEAIVPQELLEALKQENQKAEGGSDPG